MEPTQPADRFQPGVIREGCEALRAVIARIPLTDDFTWSGVQFRHWYVRFSIRCDNPLSWGVVRRLAYTLNTSVVERWQSQPFVFKPDGEEALEEGRGDRLFWMLESVVPLLDPKEVADDLANCRLAGIKSEQDWVDY